ncbi:MAG: hypothetical protein RL145_1964 [Pseudomonadota bacterium]|jgi:hypothetical protein
MTDHDGHITYRHFQVLDFMLEFVGFNRLNGRATNRNAACVQILDGRSTYYCKRMGAGQPKVLE